MDQFDKDAFDLEETRTVFKYAKTSILKQLITVWFFQLIFCILILNDVYKDGVGNITRIGDVDISFLQFTAGVLMQM